MESNPNALPNFSLSRSLYRSRGGEGEIDFLYALPVSAPSCCASNSASCCSLSISMMSGTTSTRNDVVAIQAALPVDRASFHEAYETLAAADWSGARESLGREGM